MKRFVSILFVSFLIWNYIGFFAYFQIEKQSAQREFKRKLKLSVPKDELKDFIFSPKEARELVWHKAHEFEYQGGMFDIVYSDTLANGDLIFTCISDIQETKLFEKLGEYVASDLNTNKHKPLKKLKLNLEQPSIYLDRNDYDLPNLMHSDEKTSLGIYLYSIKLGELTKDSPPPQFFTC